MARSREKAITLQRKSLLLYAFWTTERKIAGCFQLHAKLMLEHWYSAFLPPSVVTLDGVKQFVFSLHLSSRDHIHNRMELVLTE